MSADQVIFKYLWLHKSHKARNPKIAAAYLRRVEYVKKHGVINGFKG